jgi:hypothetical protein
MNYEEILKRLNSPPPEENPRPTRDIDLTKGMKKPEPAQPKKSEAEKSDAEK